MVVVVGGAVVVVVAATVVVVVVDEDVVVAATVVGDGAASTAWRCLKGQDMVTYSLKLSIECFVAAGGWILNVILIWI